ncbi:hypothetical protein V8F20_008145 [Naviculisporaceae sp. PSN 640]
MSTSIPSSVASIASASVIPTVTITSAASTSTLSSLTSSADYPLTTTFTPPVECSGIYESGRVAVVDIQTSCLPSGFRTAEGAYFSPGIACPSGYWSACHNTNSRSLTTVTCCPFRGDISLSCAGPATLSGAWQDMFCTWMAPESPGTEVLVTISDRGKTSTVTRLMVKETGPAVTGGVGIAAYGVRMVHQSADLVPVKTSPPTISESPSSSPKPSPPLAPTPWIIALAVSIPLAVVAVLIISYYWWNRRVQKYSQVSNPAMLTEFPLDPYPYKPRLSSDVHTYPEELLDSHQKHSRHVLGSDARSP